MWENRIKQDLYSNKERRFEMKKIFRRSAALIMSALMAAGAINTMAAEKASTFFTDVNENSYGWAIDYVDYIASRGIANGVGDNKYAPGDKIERGDFVIFIDKVFKLGATDSFMFSFKDVPSDSYYSNSIANAKGAGIISEDNMFYPEQYITRIDAMTMLYKAFVHGNYVGGYGTTNISMYSDAADIKNIEQQAAIGTLTAMGIVQGSNSELKPNDTMSRAEMAVIIAKAAQKVEAAEEEAAKPVEKTDEEIQEEQQKEEEQKEQNKAEESKDYIGDEVSEPIVIQHGGSVDITDSSVGTKEEAAVAISNDSTAKIDGSSITAENASAITLEDGELTIKNTDVKGNNGRAIYSINNGSIDIEDSKISSLSAAVIDLKGSALKLKGTEVTADKNRSSLAVAQDSDISIDDSSIKANSAAGVGTYEGVFSVISDAHNRGEINIDVTNSTLDNSKGALFYIRESIVNINLNGGNTIKCSKLISSPFDRKNPQVSGNEITINLKNKQNVENADIELDSTSSLALNIDSGCSYTGAINSDNSSPDVDLTIDRDGILVLTSDIFVDKFDNGMDLDFKNIQDNGWNIYYNLDNSDNDYLRNNVFDLRDGGQLIPN